jgi:hypothetical protein
VYISQNIDRINILVFDSLSCFLIRFKIFMATSKYVHNILNKLKTPSKFVIQYMFHLNLKGDIYVAKGIKFKCLRNVLVIRGGSRSPAAGGVGGMYESRRDECGDGRWFPPPMRGIKGLGAPPKKKN